MKRSFTKDPSQAFSRLRWLVPSFFVSAEAFSLWSMSFPTTLMSSAIAMGSRTPKNVLPSLSNASFGTLDCNAMADSPSFLASTRSMHRIGIRCATIKILLMSLSNWSLGLSTTNDHHFTELKSSGWPVPPPEIQKDLRRSVSAKFQVTVTELFVDLRHLAHAVKNYYTD